MAIIKKEYTTLDADLKKMNKKLYIAFGTTFLLLFVEPILSLFGLMYVSASLKSSKRLRYEQGDIGEKYAKNRLKKLDDSYNVFCDITVPVGRRSAQLDTIVVGNNGVFVVEVKNINGKVKGHIDDKYITIEKTGRKGKKYYRKLYNPYMQVSTHTKKLQSYLKMNGVNCEVTGLVLFRCSKFFIFENNAVDIKGSKDIIFTDGDMLVKKIESYNNQSIEVERVLKIIDKLYDNTEK
ncbi:MAG: nuclease-related domain-containing protein [Sarcina sp.]